MEKRRRQLYEFYIFMEKRRRQLVKKKYGHGRTGEEKKGAA